MDDRYLTPLLLYWCDDEYRRLHPRLSLDPKAIDLERLIKVAKRNKLVYLLSQNAVGQGGEWAGVFQPQLEAGKKNVALQAETLRFLNTALRDKGIDFLVIKSYRDVEYVTVDIDIMVEERNYQAAVDTMMASGYREIVRKRRIPVPGFLEHALSRVGGANLESDKLLEVDIYQDTSWTGMRCVDNAYVWQDPLTVKMCGVDCRIPNREADLLLSLAHSVYCHASINLLDFLYLSSLLESGIDQGGLLREAEKYGWERPLEKTMARIRELRHRLYHEEAGTPIAFPYKIPYRIVMDAYVKLTGNSRSGMATGLSKWVSTSLKLATMFVYR